MSDPVSSAIRSATAFVLPCAEKYTTRSLAWTVGTAKAISASAIELLLNYCLRFYDRQFTTRKKANNDLLTRFEELIDNYFTTVKAQEHGTPTMAWSASELCLSPNYFGDLIKNETGRTAIDYIQQKMMDPAKDMPGDDSRRASIRQSF